MRLTQPRKGSAMQLAIIGAGNVGTAVARAAKEAGHDVTLAAAHPEQAKRVAEELGTGSATGAREAAQDAEVIVLAVPFTAAAEVADEIHDQVAGKTVIDATNPLNEDASGLAVTDRSGAEEIQAQLDGAHVVKAFNTVFAANQSDAEAGGEQLDGFYAGDDEGAKKRVAELLAAIGFRPIDAGPLTAARALEQIAFLNISLNARNGWPWQSGWKLVGPTD